MACLPKPKLLLMDGRQTRSTAVEAGIIDLIRDLSSQFGASILFISHNLGLVRRTCNRIVVMYSGQAVESGPILDVFDRTRHPYTQGLLRSLPVPDADKCGHTLRTIPAGAAASNAPRGRLWRVATTSWPASAKRARGNALICRNH